MKSLDEYMPKGGRGGKRPGEYQLVCKACVLAKRRAHVAAVAVVAAPAAPAAPVGPRKVCTRCDRDLPLTDFAAGYDGTIDGRDFLCSSCRALAAAERERRQLAGSTASRGEYTGVGECAQCGKQDMALYQVDGNGAQPICYACLLKNVRRGRKPAAVPAATGEGA